MDSNQVLSHTKPIVNGDKCHGCAVIVGDMKSHTARYTTIAGDMTESYCQVSGCTI